MSRCTCVCRGKVSFGDLCDYVRSTAKASSGLGALSANIGGTDEDWTGVQRMQCCVFLDRNDGGLMGAFKPFGFDEHSAITWEDFAKFAHRVYEGQGPSRAGSRVETPPTAERGLRPGSKQGKSKRRGGISDRDDGSENGGDEDKSQNRRERRAGSNR